MTWRGGYFSFESQKLFLWWSEELRSCFVICDGLSYLDSWSPFFFFFKKAFNDLYDMVCTHFLVAILLSSWTRILQFCSYLQLILDNDLVTELLRFACRLYFYVGKGFVHCRFKICLCCSFTCSNTALVKIHELWWWHIYLQLWYAHSWVMPIARIYPTVGVCLHLGYVHS